MAKAKGKRNRRKEKLEFVQDYLPIRDLKNGIIETTDNRYIKILEIEPINFTLRSDEEQFNIISSFASWLKISPMRLQFKSITRRADSDKHISMICEELEHEENPQCKELGEDYIGLIKDVGNREALTRRFFLIFQYEAVGRNESDDYAKIYGMLQTAEQTARAYFMQCGNSIVQSKDPDEATAEILYMFYNRRSCTLLIFHTVLIPVQVISFHMTGYKEQQALLLFTIGHVCCGLCQIFNKTAVMTEPDILLRIRQTVRFHFQAFSLYDFHRIVDIQLKIRHNSQMIP